MQERTQMLGPGSGWSCGRHSAEPDDRFPNHTQWKGFTSELQRMDRTPQPINQRESFDIRVIARMTTSRHRENVKSHLRGSRSGHERLSQRKGEGVSEAARRKEVLDNRAKHNELRVEMATMAIAASDAGQTQ